jgi:hypothetical protein
MPIPKKLERTIKKFAKKDGKIAKKFYPYLEKPGDLPLYVLRQSGREVDWLILGVIDKWSAELNTFWNRTQFNVSTTRTDFGKDADETFYQIVTRASHIAKGNGEVYSIREGTGVQIFDLQFAYGVLGDLNAQITFDLADAEYEWLNYLTINGNHLTINGNPITI